MHQKPRPSSSSQSNTSAQQTDLPNSIGMVSLESPLNGQEGDSGLGSSRLRRLSGQSNGEAVFEENIGHKGTLLGRQMSTPNFSITNNSSPHGTCNGIIPRTSNFMQPGPTNIHTNYTTNYQPSPTKTITPSCLNDETFSDSLDDLPDNLIGPKSREKVNHILSMIEQLPEMEQLYLYFKMPPNSSNSSIERRSSNSGGTKNSSKLGPVIDEDHCCVLTHHKRSVEKLAGQWIGDQLELCEDTSLARKDVYDDYLKYTQQLKGDHLVQSDFGKIMRQIFPEVQSRRLGSRGASKYCYSGLRKRMDNQEPTLPSLGASSKPQPKVLIKVRFEKF